MFAFLKTQIVRHRELIQLKMINEMDLITQLRLNQSSISSTNSSQEGTVTTSDEQETIDNEQYLQIMDTNNRNWEIPRHRIIITQREAGRRTVWSCGKKESTREVMGTNFQ